MMFCAYCGNRFTRKEHLERHLPTHTNVKPHRCGICQIGFSRRDLLQRHHSTYHETRDPMEPLPGSAPTVAGRTAIACLNCAQAKTGCDKMVPCARCRDKNLPCEARFARRSSKAALRAAQATAAINNNSVSIPLPPPPSVTTPTVNPACMDLDSQTCHQEQPLKDPTPPEERPMTIDPRIAQHDSLTRKNSPPNTFPTPDNFHSPPHSRVEGLDDLMQLGPEYSLPQEPSYQDMFVWPDYPLEFDMYSNPVPLAPADVPMSTFGELSDISSSNSEHISSSRGSIHTRSTSIMSISEFEPVPKPTAMTIANPKDAAVPEFEVVIAAESAWPLARCTPLTYSGSCPRTAIVHLECLEQKATHEGTWSALEQYLDQVDWDASDLASVVPMDSRTRDKMLAITQSFLHKALEIHRGGPHSRNKRYASPGLLTFLVLPPSKILEYFLRSYARNLSFFYSLIHSGCVDPNEMIQNNQAATLLVLLMIAQGASAVPTTEARALSAGLIETCRISLFDIIEKDIEMSADPTVLRCALLFTLLGAWSGDKWLMDIAMGQRGMYISMMKHAGLFEAQSSGIPSFDSSTNVDLAWRSWQHQEMQNRLAYNWVMVDQELSLFHDTAPLLAVSDLRTPLPGPELLWMSTNADQWMSTVQSTYGGMANIDMQLFTTPSLFDLFQEFLHDDLTWRQNSISPQQLRLLLHPLQSLLCHLRQMLSCFPDVLVPRRVSSQTRTVTRDSTMQRLEEVQTLLQKWYGIAIAYLAKHPSCAVSKTNLVLYHLISLNAVTNFAEIERLARREALNNNWDLAERHKRCIYQREDSIFHSGQVLRLVRAMPADRRPSWWSAAVYRATLILWIDGISRLDPNFQKREEAGVPVLIDQVIPDDPSMLAYLWDGDGLPVLTRQDGSVAGLDKPADTLDYAVRTLEDGISSRFSDGIRRKLAALRNNWVMDDLNNGGANGVPAANTNTNT
ncbi:hypothetical protein F5Y16DRAFT_200999 [Xylariaceae sp. FL0255]|nr:hypothetical protein F5Y16DRAFT_200999 [Xylariaceae sp. FL0255]